MTCKASSQDNGSLVWEVVSLIADLEVTELHGKEADSAWAAAIFARQEDVGLARLGAARVQQEQA